MVRGLKEFSEPLEAVEDKVNNSTTRADIERISSRLSEYSREASAILAKLENDSKAIDEHYSGLKLEALKKRKREDEESSTAQASATTSSSTPTGQRNAPLIVSPDLTQTTLNPFKLKIQTNKPKRTLSFDLPSTSQLPRPARTKPLPPTPKTQDIVNDDFVDKKPASQTQISTFYSSIEPYLRPLGEDDLMFLSAKGDEVTPYTIPPLGRPYLSVWEAEDAGLPFTSIDQPSIPPLPRPTLTAQDMSDDSLINEDFSLGALSERLVSALLPINKPTEEYTNETQDVTTDKVAVGMLDDFLRRELISIGILNEGDLGPTQPIDDEISVQLAHLQNILQVQSQMNTSRRLHLLGRAKERMAAQEYITLLTDVEKTIEAGWAKRQKQLTRIKKKKTEKAAQIAQQQAAKKTGKLPPPTSGSSTPITQSNSNADLMSDLGESVKRAIECRNLLIQNVGKPLMQENELHPGKYFGLKEQEAGAIVANIRDSVDISEKEPSMAPEEEDEDIPIVEGVRLR
ncbi:hypothetical protein E3Q05_02089 [Wallemia mellicola]|nr:hypothetical protein E3Q05_02089 [Wallemia mellicola]